MASTFSSAKVLMSKGKRGAAAYIRDQYCNSVAGDNKQQNINELLDTLLNPGKPIDDWETIDWCKWLMAGGRTPDEFSSTVRLYDNATTCGLVWTPNFVAYRCRTCGISPCMALCQECFKKGNHYRHDFNMFLSQAGGACDCGDTSVMKEIGFCDRHGPKAVVDKSPAPLDLMCVAEAMMPRMILRLIQHLRENCKVSAPDFRVAIQDADAYLTMLLDLNHMGALMRHVMTSVLTSPQKYRGLMDPTNSTGIAEYDRYCQESHDIYQDAIKSLPNPEPLDEYKDCPSLQEDLVHTTFLEELMFWTVAYEFPQKLVCLLLNMLPDPDYKEALTKAFVLHYSRIAMMLERSNDPDTLSNRVVHVSVQLFSNERLALRMVDQLKLLHVMVISLKYMMSKILVENTLHAPNKNFHFVVDCGRPVMKEHCYWPLVSDLNNVLSHKPVAVRFLSDDALLEMWFDFLSMFQGMNVNQREMGAHVEFEPTTYYAAFSAELEASAYPMWALVSHLRGPESISVSRRALSFCLTALQDWLDAIGFTSPDVCDVLHVSFHIPLHRYFAVFMCEIVRQQGVTLEELLPPTDMLHLLMMHPLRVQVALYEILNGLWVRNGLQIKGQAMTYIQCNFCNSMVDADLYLLQICAMKLQPDIFLKTVIDKFHVKEWLSLRTVRSRQNVLLIGEHDTAMMESCLIFLATLISVRTNLGLTDSEVSHLEMVTLLCMGDKTHSQLMDLMPERCGTTPNRDFEPVLGEVAQYKAPNLEASGTMQQGMYGPKPQVWEELYDPLYVLLRAVHRRDYQVSMDRYTEYVKSTKLKSGSTLWPPFRNPAPVSSEYDDPRVVLKSRVFHAMAFVILYKAVNDHNISEHIVALLVYLLEMAVVTSDIPKKSANPLCPYTGSVSCAAKDADFSNWYETDSLVENLKTVIPRSTIIHSSSEYNPENNSDWEIASDITESSLMLNDEFDVDIGESPEVWDLDLLGETDNEHRNTTAPMETGSLPALPANETLAEWDLTIVPADEVPRDNIEDHEIPARQRALPPAVEESMALVPNTHSPRLLPMTESSRFSRMPQRGTANSATSNEVDLLQVLFPRLGAAGVTSTDIVPSTSHCQQQIVNRDTQSGQMYQAGSKTGENIISLLLKLHSQLSGVPDSWNPDEVPSFVSDEGSSASKIFMTSQSLESRIGDGPFFIGQLLKKISRLDPSLNQNITEIRNKIWPQNKDCEDAQREREHREREEKRKKAKERQQKLMADFANQQKQFMKKAMETDEAGASGMDWDHSETSNPLTSKKEYDCVICNRTTSSTDEKPMGLVVLVQATSVIGHERQQSERLQLPTSDDDSSIPKNSTRGAYFDYRIDEMHKHFDTFSWLLSVNLGWEGGVYVQTCGHHLHLDCLKAYRQSLRSQQRQQSLAVERGEYLCPLCRQLANSVLPLSPQLGECSAIVRSRHTSTSAILSELNNFLKEIQRNPVSSNLSMAMGKAMEEMTASTYLKYKQKNCQPSHQSLFLFVTSVARTNLEVELVQRGGSLCSSLQETVSLTPKRDCIVALFHVLAMHARVLTNWPVHQTWQYISGLPSDLATPLAVAPHEREVPFLLRDPTALLIQFILLLPLHIDQTYFSSVVKVIYNLLYYQVIVQVSCTLTKSERNKKTRLPERNTSSALMSSDSIIRMVINHFEQTDFYEDEPSYRPGRSTEQQIQTLCLPFLRIAALLRHHLYSQPLPDIRIPEDEFVRLVYYLELVTEGMDWDCFNAAVALNWQNDEVGITVPQMWCDQFLAFYRRSQIAAKRLIADQHIFWQAPKLLSLPREYEKLFTFYHARQCCKCHLVPPEISICLLCGTIVCLKQTCCKQQNVGEAVQHSIDCGGGTGIYLVVTSTYIIVIRGRRACLWGSLYLDDFEEEDKDLKRGRPLYLSQERYQLLEQQWLAHRFDHTKKTWVWHRDAL
ncbi:E3 ubiquitin-protein ligase Ubr3 [Microplitis demolitor]|uniref:E3 ubiquitin-protein ligase Ubr3 n=1 Tax=Microplitis demolitor TaxID=69319 RepID=UPI0004CD120C|nr:E3 ubiquitin-protein ligase Ubr3 [Microplitis demolitor]XP_053595394.1 E3 ubiquitin-protein ligase Ubr3 [Microplitis demolitor]XP_053595395.1 E3 ubiquitin-protein ligase Ubr3 [Microplitis demolitor]XP_053595396.1 E3 ubiquitin-protein ligase Ubr3 [Microplitis demolitor]